MIPNNETFTIFYKGYTISMLGIANILEMKETVYEN